jgi:hypothetical protein
MEIIVGFMEVKKKFRKFKRFGGLLVIEELSKL